MRSISLCTQHNEGGRGVDFQMNLKNLLKMFSFFEISIHFLTAKTPPVALKDIRNIQVFPSPSGAFAGIIAHCPP